MIGARIPDEGLSLGDADRYGERPSFDPIWDDPMANGTETLRASDLDRRAPCALDLCAHLHEHRRQVLDLGFAGGVLDDRRSRRRHRSHEQVLGCPDARELEHHACPRQAVGARLDEAVHDVELDAHRLETTEVHGALAFRKPWS